MANIGDLDPTTPSTIVRRLDSNRLVGEVVLISAITTGARYLRPVDHLVFPNGEDPWSTSDLERNGAPHVLCFGIPTARRDLIGNVGWLIVILLLRYTPAYLLRPMCA